MRILLISLGTQGDIEPFISQAALLQADGHEIHCLFPEQFRMLVIELGYEFSGFDARFLELLTSDFGRAFLGGKGSFLEKGKNFFKLIKASFSLQANLLNQQKQVILQVNPNRVFFHPKAVYCLLAASNDPKRFIQLSPVPCILHAHKDFPNLGLSKFKPFNSKWNLASYKLISSLKYLVIWKYLKPHRSDFSKLSITKKSLAEFERNGMTTWYQISPTLFPKPAYWPVNALVTGYLARNQKQDYVPDPKLVAWLQKNPKAILLTFGSMVNHHPEQISEVILNTLEKHQVPTIVNLSWGGLVRIKTSSDLFFFVEKIPYDWALPQLYGIIHHGGSGTTHSAARAGVVQLLVPHIMDQYFWNRLVANLGLGPLGVPISRLKPKSFEKVVLEFWTNQEFKTKAAEIASKIEHET
jgi:UDP:flavonoid glycosyltransferase YjiC (YdhE family)